MPGTTILYIDDDVLALSSLVPRLEAAGYTVFRSSDPDHGWILFEESHPDLVLIEVGMARGKGWELFDQLVAAGATVFIVSAQGLEEDVLRGLESGAIDYIAKPYRTAELLARIRLRIIQTMPQDATSPWRALPPAAPSPSTIDELAFPEAPVPPAPAVHEDDLASDGSLGARFRSARRERNISLVQAELETNIRMYYIQALEEGKFALLPRGPAADRIVREYARFLGLNSQELASEYRRLHSNESEPAHDLGPAPLTGMRPAARLLGWLLAALLALVLICGALSLVAPRNVEAIWTNLRALVSAPDPSATPAPLPTATATPSPTSAPTATASPSPSPSATRSPSPRPTQTRPPATPTGSATP